MPMPEMTWEQFRADMLAAGSDEVLERPWAPDTVLPVHTHPFEAHALVVHGRDVVDRRWEPGVALVVR